MAGKARFKFDKNFDTHLRHPKPRTSLHPLGDKLRDVADNIGDSAQASIRREQAVKESEVQAIKNGSLDANAGRPGHGYLRAKAEAFALKVAGDNTYAYMTGVNGDLGARVVTSQAVEFGGTEPRAQLYRTNQYASLPAYAPLRRAMDRQAKA
jgi:hypothetical protein